MSEPLGVEDRARLRAEAENLKPGEFYPGATVTVLLDEVDRLTEALEAAEMERDEWRNRLHRQPCYPLGGCLRSAHAALLDRADDTKEQP